MYSRRTMVCCFGGNAVFSVGRGRRGRPFVSFGVCGRRVEEPKAMGQGRAVDPDGLQHRSRKKKRGWSPACAFAKSQGLTTTGQAGYAYFSTNAASYPENHIGFDPNLAMIPLFAVIMAALGLLARDVRDRPAGAMLMLGMISIVGVVLLRWFNVLLPYELWLRLGMPDSPF